LASSPLVVFSTHLGEIVVELDHARAPKTAAHFEALIADGWLDDGGFYRTVHKSNTPGQLPTIDVIQGGLGFELANTMPSVEHEPTNVTGLRHVTGTISLARGADTLATGEFFICLGDFPVLDASTLEGPGAIGFAAFGRVIAGLDVAKVIHKRPAEAPTPPGWDILKNQFISEPVPLRPSLRAG
jgi:peptidyl-prolyl cis-trans isomerase A (cyclophilin A)